MVGTFIASVLVILEMGLNWVFAVVLREGELGEGNWEIEQEV